MITGIRRIHRGKKHGRIPTASKRAGIRPGIIILLFCCEIIRRPYGSTRRALRPDTK